MVIPRPLFLFEAIRMSASQRLDQRGFSVVNVAGGADNHVPRGWVGDVDRLGAFAVFDAIERLGERSNHA